MRILLINPIARAWALPNCVPLGLGYIASVLREKGHDVDLIDLNGNRSINPYLPVHLDYDLIGLTGIITQYGEVKRLAAKCREFYPETSIICGGSLATSVPELLLKKTKVNSCIVGEGERIVFDVLNGIIEDYEVLPKYHSGKLIKNISTIPWPAYDLMPMEIYINNPIAADNVNKWKAGEWTTEKRRSIDMIGSRGCVPGTCIYCYHCYMGNGWRIRQAEDILAEMLMLKDRYGIEYVHFVDDAFACSKSKIVEFCRMKSRSTLADIKWSCAGRANVMDEEMAKAMADSGCIGICYGLESGSQKMLDVMNKKIKVKQYEVAIKLNKKYFEYQDYTFITGTPGETDETIDESIRFCKRNRIIPSAVFYMTPYPGTALFKRLLDNDDMFFEMWRNIDSFEKFILSLGEQGEKITWNCSGASDEKLIEWHDRFIEETGAWNNQKHS